LETTTPWELCAFPRQKNGWHINCRKRKGVTSSGWDGHVSYTKRKSQCRFFKQLTEPKHKGHGLRHRILERNDGPFVVFQLGVECG
jgi:hypothetical protein